MISNKIREALQKVCRVLNTHQVDFMIVGGVAVGYYGYQRISGISISKPEMKTDLDFWYNPTTENFWFLLNALEELEINIESLRNIVFDPKKTFLKIPHKNFHTDFLPQMSGLRPYRECKADAIKQILDGNEIHIISLNDLLSNKKAIAREIDLKDIEALEQKRKGSTPGMGDI